MRSMTAAFSAEPARKYRAGVAAAHVQPGRDQFPGAPGQRDGADLIALAVQADLAGAGGHREGLGVQAGALLNPRPCVEQHRDDRGITGPRPLPMPRFRILPG
jgi:hypothetical protein